MMTATSESTDDPHATRASSTTETRYRRIAACVDDSAVTGKVIGHAVAIANALGAELVLMHVVEPKESHGAPTDPVEWNLRRREASSHVEMLARDRADEVEAIHATVVEGHAAEQICIWARDHRVDLTVVGTSGEGHAREWELGSTARRVVDSAPGSVLLVPACVEDAPSIHYRRLLVPLDGSSRAESALPIALRVAEAENAEIVLAHAVPEPELTEIGPLEPEDEELRMSVIRRNERVAREYLDRTRARIAAQGISVTVWTVRGGDVRRLIARAVLDQRADLSIMSSHGQSGHADVASGSVAEFLIGHATVPVLIVRQQSDVSRRRGYPAPVRAGIRLPSAAMV